MSSFEIWWAIFALAIVVLAGFAGKWANGSAVGILIDSRGRVSLTHVQIVAWTVLILSAFLAALVASCFDAKQAGLSEDLLGLMGIAAGSAVLATGVKAAKDAKEEKDPVVKVARADATRTVVAPDGTATKVKFGTKFSQIWLEEEGEFADRVINATKFQNFLFTLAAIAMFVALAIKAHGLPPELPKHFLALLGISHAGYVGGKIPDKK